MMSEALAPVLERIDAELDESIERLKALLRIPSIGTDSSYDDDTRRAATFCAEQLNAIGFDASVRDTPGQPMVVAHASSARADAPTILYYGHYDVQPPDPVELWDSPPFEPTMVRSRHGEKIVARGAVDDKGQLMTFLEAFRAWHDVHGSYPVNLTVMLEGEEESGSPSLDGFLESNRDELAADVCIVCDTGMYDIDTPAITYMLRGLCYIEITLTGPSHDLHSGMYGGAVVNPINALCGILADIHDAQGRVQFPGFYDDVRDLSPEERAQWEALDFDDAQFLAGAGLNESIGERERTVLERIWSRPTCDINGIWGGYTGRGAKTVIASHASAKLSCRLVADQDPQKVLAGIRRFLDERTPPDCTIELEQHGLSPAIRVPTDSAFLRASMKGLETIYNRAPVLIGCGGSIPVVGSFQHILSFDSLLVGFGLDDDRVHSPNEKFELRCYHMGIRSHAAILAELSQMRGARPIGQAASAKA